MDTPIEESRYVPPASIAPPPPPPAPTIEPAADEGAAERFDTRKAINYSTANMGAAFFYALFNFGMPLYLDAYKLPAWLIGLIANERSFVGAFVQPWIGRVSDRTRSPLGRRRPFFLIGIPLVSVALLLLAFQPPFWIMLGIMTVTAFFLAIAWDPYMALMADIFPPLHRGRVGGLSGLGTGIGNIAFIILAITLWGTSMFAVFAIVVVVMLLTWGYTFFTVKEPPIAAVETHKEPKVNLVQYVKNLRNYPEAAKYTLAINFFWLGAGGAAPFITLFGTKVLNTTEQQAFILPLGAVVMTALFSIPAGILADRIASKKKVMTGGLLIYGLAALIGSQSTTLWQGVAVLAVVGIGNSAMSQINPMLTDLIPRKRTAEFIGLGSAVFSFAQPLGSVFAGLVVGLSALFVGEHDTYRWAFIWAGVLILTSAALLQTVKPERAITD